ncbi:DUF484 family protein [Marichromatium bheemlicum]|uniref:DUF484 family protein n=1 Tax=Marichromatium bheemlicum TaxID=365339 RepID=A0ABX1I9W3_9GAMM|nr:DUF484 family protein [Marichromatium bheemlicum]
MITQAEQPEDRDEAQEATVAAYLQRHPDFFEHHPEILSALRIPHPTGAGAISLIERQVRTLRQELDTERQRLGQLIARAREYESLSTRLHALVLKLIAINDPEQLCTRLREVLLQEFRADAVTLRLFPRDPETAATDPLGAAFEDFLARKHALCGPLDGDKAEVLFGEAATRVRTAALVPIRTGARSGVLAIGSADPERFRPELGTDLLDRLGEIIAHKLNALTTVERCDQE